MSFAQFDLIVNVWNCIERERAENKCESLSSAMTVQRWAIFWQMIPDSVDKTKPLVSKFSRSLRRKKTFSFPGRSDMIGCLLRINKELCCLQRSVFQTARHWFMQLSFLGHAWNAQHAQKYTSVLKMASLILRLFAAFAIFNAVIYANERSTKYGFYRKVRIRKDEWIEHKIMKVIN